MGYPPRLFILPARIVLGNLFLTESRQEAVIYLPLLNPAIYASRTRRLDVWKYEGAWHLFGSERKAASITNRSAISA